MKDAQVVLQASYEFLERTKAVIFLQGRFEGQEGRIIMAVDEDTLPRHRNRVPDQELGQDASCTSKAKPDLVHLVTCGEID
ncbi:hypothetical protein ACLB2K_025144 [Fragaria x ananassa]